MGHRKEVGIMLDGVSLLWEYFIQFSFLRIGSHCVVLVDLRLTKICLSLLLEYWD